MNMKLRFQLHANNQPVPSGRIVGRREKDIGIQKPERGASRFAFELLQNVQTLCLLQMVIGVPTGDIGVTTGLDF